MTKLPEVLSRRYIVPQSASETSIAASTQSFRAADREVAPESSRASTLSI